MKKSKTFLTAAVLGTAFCSSSGMQASENPVPAYEAPDAVFTATGTVVDANGEPVIGATVREKGKPTNGCSTDVDGNYTLKVRKGAKLEISYVGCVTATIDAGKGMSTTLQDDAKVLDDVVVVGFGTQKKANLTGAVAVASGKEIENRPVRTAAEALQGLLPGLQLTREAGDIETDMSIQIRGTGTIGLGSSGAPLILIDGSEGDINTVNPQDIESISVLKDAAASSIYGSRAPFGVIMVTTKKGSMGRPKINYNNNFRWSSPIGLPEMMNSYDFALFQNQAYWNNGWNGFFSDETIENMINFAAQGGTYRGGLPTRNNGTEWGSSTLHAFNVAYANTDWLHELYKDSFSQEHNASVSGGNQNYNYYAAFGFNDIHGMLNHGKDSRKRYNATGKFSAKLTSWAEFRYSVRYVHSDTNVPSRFGDDWYNYIGAQTWPNLPIYDENGYYYSNEGGAPAMGLAQGGTRLTDRDETYQQAGLTIEPLKNWFIRGEFNYRIDQSKDRQTRLPIYDHYVDGSIKDMQYSSSLYQSFFQNKYANWNVYSDYTFSIKDAHNFKVMAGFQSEEKKQEYFNVSAYGLQDYELPELDLTTNLQGNGEDKAPSVHGRRNQWSILGFFGRINYDYKGKYLLEANLRYDGSSRFRSDRRWTWSPSASLGWNIAEESFWESIHPVVNLLKLRASFGHLSNQNTNDWYPTYRTMSTGTANGDWLQGNKRPNASWVNGLISTYLTWEKIKTWNIGLDWGLFNNRLTGSVDAFIRDTDDMLGPPVELPNTLGLTAPSENNCALRTTGWELQITWRDVTPFGLGYSISANISDARTKIKAYPGNITGDIANYNPGHYLGEIQGLTSIGIAKSQEEMDAHLAALDRRFEEVNGYAPATPLQGQSWYGTNWAAGDMMYKDVNGDGQITWGDWNWNNPGDMTVIGNTTPRYFFGIDLTANYKGFDFRAFFQGVGKRDFYSRSPLFWGAFEGGIWQSTGFKVHEDYFRAEDVVFNYTDHNGNPAQYVLPANLDSYYPRPLHNFKNQEWQTRYLQNAAYIRCKNMQLGYTLPQSITGRLGISQLRLYVSVDNLFTITKLSKVFDPENVGGGSSLGGRTGDGNTYPMARTWSCGLSISI